ncbi:hypothetical protein FF011L_43210 [Roseimaritima multifibrata]|uniref:HEAT repeat protein n=2 Tax=Roseimaritima multifibrata TaxID=1930274 RepID=A0A517MKX0_9BACT|nr:hypothetical protein FF011L_43210 [Roseimaritima multifibrata]
MRFEWKNFRLTRCVQSLRWVGVAAVPFCFQFAAAADTLELTHGTSVAGNIRQFENDPRPYALVQLHDGLRIAIRKSDVRKTRDAELIAQYRQLAARAPDTVEGQYEMARWCTKNSLSDHSEFHMRRVIAIDPEHGPARESLDYVKRRDEWIPRKQWARERGLVRSAGRYQLPEDLAMQAESKEVDIKVKAWKRDIARWRMAYLRGGDKAGEALVALRAIDSPLAVPALGDELTNPRNQNQPHALRLLWIQLLGQFAMPAAVEPLVRVGVQENDPVIREAAYERLQNYGYQSAVRTYVPMLKSSNNAEVNQAGRALSFLPDPEIRFALVDALVTSHTTTKRPQHDTNVTLGQNGGAGGLSMGAKATSRTDHLRNPHVLSALREIAPEVDFQYDKDRWRQYFAQQLGSYQGDMRRDQ